MNGLTIPEFWEFPIGQDLVVARPDLHGLFLFNSTARLIWDARRQAPDDIARLLADTFGISLETAKRDVTASLAYWNRELLASKHPDPFPSPVCSLSVRDEIACGSLGEYYRIHGKIFRIDVGSDEIYQEISPRLVHLRTPPSVPDFSLRVCASSNGICVFREDELVAVEESVAAARTILLQEIVRLSVPGREWLALLHAGAYGRNCKCVIFPAESRSGKTTLAAVLMASGSTLYSDDSIGLEKGSLSIPVMPFALAVREGTWPILAQYDSALERLPVYSRFGENLRYVPPKLLPDTASARATAIVFSKWSAEARTSVTTLDTLETLAHLRQSGFWVEHNRQSIQTFLDWIQALPSYNLLYSNVAEAAAIIHDLIGAA